MLRFALFPPHLCPPPPSLSLTSTLKQKGGLECRFRTGIASGERHPSLRDRVLAVHGGFVPQQNPVPGGDNGVYPPLLGSVVPDRSSRRLDLGR